jgi:hypothetical protein
MRMAFAIASLLASAWPAGCQQVQWARLFEDLSSRDPVLVEAAERRVVDEIGPQLSKEKPELLAAEIPAIIVQLNREDGDIRIRASGLIVLLTQLRPDSAVVLSAAVPPLIDHVEDTVSIVGRNSLAVLCSLEPEIPPRALQYLLMLMQGKDENLAVTATFGAARMANSRPEVVDALCGALLPANPLVRRRAAVRAIARERVINPRLNLLLGTLLADRNESMVREALGAIDRLGVDSITLNSVEIRRLAETSGNPELVKLARQLLGREAVRR